MFVIRWVLGRIILFFDFIFSPKKPKRSADLQAEIDANTAHLSLYQLPACPFCVKVRRQIKRNGLNIDIKNINKNEVYLEELIDNGGKRTVPCLRIVDEKSKEVRWMYESSMINQYLQQFAR